MGGQFLTNIAGFVIPGYYSLEALFSVSKTDDTQWLTVRFSTTLPIDNPTNSLRIVLGSLFLFDCLRERYQCCLLVPILLHFQVHLPSLARTSSYWVRNHTPLIVSSLNQILAAHKSSSAPSSNQSSAATSPELVQLLPTFVQRSMTRPCKRKNFLKFPHDCQVNELRSTMWRKYEVVNEYD